MENYAVIVPYRNRENHLQEFVNCGLSNIHLIEQMDDKKFNAGRLKNIGFDLLKDKYDYFIFHDIDIIPIAYDYSFPIVPTRIWSGLYEYDDYFGGVVIFNKEDFLKTNGYGNNYWGWGIEDDDLFKRVQKKVGKWDTRYGKFKLLKHPTNYNEQDYIINTEIMNKGDSSGLDNLTYHVKNIEENEKYKKISVALQHNAMSFI